MQRMQGLALGSYRQAGTVEDDSATELEGLETGDDERGGGMSVFCDILWFILCAVAILAPMLFVVWLMNVSREDEKRVIEGERVNRENDNVRRD